MALTLAKYRTAAKDNGCRATAAAIVGADTTREEEEETMTRVARREAAVRAAEEGNMMLVVDTLDFGSVSIGGFWVWKDLDNRRSSFIQQRRQHEHELLLVVSVQTTKNRSKQ